MKPNFLLIILCSYFHHSLANTSPTTFPSGPSEVTFFGTKYCGHGKRAEYYDDLGHEAETDKCCRDHDFCPEMMAAGEEKYGLKNSSSYTRLQCDCDRTFYHCLKEVVEKTGSKTASMVGYVYFNVLGNQCYEKNHRITGCSTYPESDRCEEYYFDETTERIWQWFHVPHF